MIRDGAGPMSVRRFVRELRGLRLWRYWKLLGRTEALRMCREYARRTGDGSWRCPIVALAEAKRGTRINPAAAGYAARLLGLSHRDKTRIMIAADWTVRDRWGRGWWVHVDAWRHWRLRRRLLRAVGIRS